MSKSALGILIHSLWKNELNWVRTSLIKRAVIKFSQEYTQYSFIHSFNTPICTSIHPSVQPLMTLFIHSFIHLFIHSFIHLFYSFIHSFIQVECATRGDRECHIVILLGKGSRTKRGGGKGLSGRATKKKNFFCGFPKLLLW